MSKINLILFFFLRFSFTDTRVPITWQGCVEIWWAWAFFLTMPEKKKTPSSRRRIKEIYLHLIHRCYHLLYGTYFSKILCDASSSQHNPPLDALISGFFGRRRSTLSRGFGSWASRVLFCFFCNFCFVPFGLPSERIHVNCSALCPLAEGWDWN